MADQDPLAILETLYASQPWGKAGGGQGSGFADRDYWLAHPSEILNGRLGADLAGTGPDQPEGTPGTGVWQQSGKNRQGILTPSGLPAGSWATPSVPDASGTQNALLGQSLQTLTPQIEPFRATAPGLIAPATGTDQILGGYDDELRRQIMDQMKAE